MSDQSSGMKGLYAGLSKPMRRVVISGLLALVYAVLDILVIQPVMEEFSEVTRAIEQAKSDSKKAAVSMLNLQNQFGIDPTLSDKEQIDLLAVTLDDVEKEIQILSSEFVSTQDMIPFVSRLIKQRKGLELVTLEKLTSKRISVKTVRDDEILELADEGSGKNTSNNNAPKEKSSKVIGTEKVYQHGVKVSLVGKYSDIVAYVQTIENMKWRIFIEKLELETEKYPNSAVTFELYTVSLDDAWLVL